MLTQARAPRSITHRIAFDATSKRRIDENGFMYVEATRHMYLHADAETAPAGVVRPLAKGGDMIFRPASAAGAGTWWLVTATPEDFSRTGWVLVRATLQVKAPDFSASDWWEKDQ